MIARVVVVPAAPLLVEELTVRANPALQQLRGACLAAASSLAQATTEWVVLGVDRSGLRQYATPLWGTWRGFGVDVPVRVGSFAPVSDSLPETPNPRRPLPTEPDPALPLPALLGGWLASRVGIANLQMHLLHPDTPSGAPEILQIAADVAGSKAAGSKPAGERRLGLLVLAEGTDCRDSRSPRPADPRAPELDAQLRHALAHADLGTLSTLDPTLCSELGVHARPALQALAEMAGEQADHDGTSWQSELLYSATPFGVTYHVATWHPV